MITIFVKALSANRAFKGRRFRTKEYDAFEKEMFYALREIKAGVIPNRLHIQYVFGLSSKNSDLGNCEKQCTDVLTKKFGFNDKNVYKITMERVDVKKGKEFIKFDFENYGQI